MVRVLKEGRVILKCFFWVLNRGFRGGNIIQQRCVLYICTTVVRSVRGGNIFLQIIDLHLVGVLRSGT